MKFRMISLGCPKNLVESEYITEKLEKSGHINTDEDCDTVIINTCAFISDAVKESVDVILTEAKNKNNKRIIVTGCLIERYKNSLPDLLPEVDLFIGRGFYTNIKKIIEEKGFFYTKGVFSETYPRKVLTALPTAYLKIQEGCDNRCSYCSVPDIRGSLVSRQPDAIKREFSWLLSKGYREINIIGQDITSYGRDRGDNLKDLLRNLLETKGDYYLRLLYLHPSRIDDDLIEIIRKEDRIIKYMDIPIQHSEDSILKKMNRGYTKTYLEHLFEKIKDRIPQCVLRTTVIVGFPGESEGDFENLCVFIKRWRFDNLGAFKYSREEGTPAYRLKGGVKKSVQEERYKRIMELQREISKTNLKRLVGKESVLIVESKEEGGMTGRLITQAPDIDGIAFIRGDCKIGDIISCKIVKTLDYDVIVKV